MQRTTSDHGTKMLAFGTLPPGEAFLYVDPSSRSSFVFSSGRNLAVPSIDPGDEEGSELVDSL